MTAPIEERGAEGAYHIAAEARAEASAAKARLDSHEQQCAERYAGINAQLGEIKAIINRGVYMLLAAMAGLIVALLRAGFHF
jgi:hypothetical protein